MSEDPIRQYSGATNELDIALKNVQSMSKYILSVGDALRQNPFRFMVSNVKTGFPIEVTFDKGAPSLNADKWPTAEKSLKFFPIYTKRNSL